MFPNLFKQQSIQQPQTGAPAPGVGAPSSGVIDPNAATTPNPALGATPPPPPVSPFAEFSDLFNNKPVNKDTAPQGIFGGPLDTKKLVEAARNINFTQGIDQQTLTDMAGGGEKGVAAIIKTLNEGLQLAYAHGAALTRNMMETGATKIEGRLKETLPEHLKLHNLNDSVLESNPAFRDPAVQPLVQALTQQFAQNYPQASASELNQMALKYLTTISEAVTKKQAPGGGNNGNSGQGNSGSPSGLTDFESFLNS